MVTVQWDIRREGRSWVAGEALARYQLTPDKIEMVRGKLFNSDEERTIMLGLLLENLGADAAVRLVTRKSGAMPWRAFTRSACSYLIGYRSYWWTRLYPEWLAWPPLHSCSPRLRCHRAATSHCPRAV